MGDSSNSNMATAQIDIQPWKTEVHIDRFDFQPVLHRIYQKWKIDCAAKGIIKQKNYKHDFYYSVLFEHPDPVKNANARAIDLASGSKTLHMIYSEGSRNPRRELQKEDGLLGITVEELIKHLLVTRSNKNIEVINEDSDR
jgi:hypothetical protein